MMVKKEEKLVKCWLMPKTKRSLLSIKKKRGGLMVEHLDAALGIYKKFLDGKLEEK